MKKHLGVLILVLSIVLINTPIWAEEPVSLPLNKLQQDSEFFSPILGLCEDYPYGTWAEDIEQDFALMADYGISDIRVSIAWRDYEFARGYTDWWLMDDKVDLAEQYGITLYPYICYAPTWATGASMMSPPLDYEDWYNFVFELVSRYKGRIPTWELWNEGDNEEFWVGTWEEQLELIKVGAQAVKAADPDAKTVFGGLTNLDPNHVNTIFTSGVADYIDIINIHFYHETWNPSRTEQIYSDVKAIADVIRRHGGKQELWIAEIGYSDYVDENGQVSYWVRTRAPYEKTREFQGVTFARAYARIAATEDVSNILWYELKNLSMTSSAIGDVNNYYLGALDHDYFPKHLWFAIANVNELFAPGFRSIDDRLVVESKDGITPYVHAFERENGDVILMAWQRGASTESIQVTVPQVQGRVFQYSVTGVKNELSYTSSGNDTTMVLELDPADIQIIEIVTEDVSRITLRDVEVTHLSGDSYTISAKAINLGENWSPTVVAEVFGNNDVELLQEATWMIGELAPGEEVEIFWDVEINNSEDAEAWISLRGAGLAPSAILLQF